MTTRKTKIKQLPYTTLFRSALTNAKNKEEAEAVRTKVKNRIDNEYDTILRRINEADSNDKVDAETAKISELKKFDRSEKHKTEIQTLNDLETPSQQEKKKAQ